MSKYLELSTLKKRFQRGGTRLGRGSFGDAYVVDNNLATELSLSQFDKPTIYAYSYKDDNIYRHEFGFDDFIKAFQNDLVYKAMETEDILQEINGMLKVITAKIPNSNTIIHYERENNDYYLFFSLANIDNRIQYDPTGKTIIIEPMTVVYPLYRKMDGDLEKFLGKFYSYFETLSPRHVNLQLTLSMTNFLKYLHNSGYYHYDLKLQNVLYEINNTNTNTNTNTTISFAIGDYGMIDSARNMKFRGTYGYISPLFFKYFGMNQVEYNAYIKLLSQNPSFKALYGEGNGNIIWASHSRLFDNKNFNKDMICQYNDYYGYYVTLYMFYKQALVKLNLVNSVRSQDYKGIFGKFKTDVVTTLKNADYTSLQQGGASRRKHIVYRNNKTKSYLVHKDGQGEYIMQRGLGKVYLKEIRGKYLLG